MSKSFPNVGIVGNCWQHCQQTLALSQPKSPGSCWRVGGFIEIFEKLEKVSTRVCMWLGMASCIALRSQRGLIVLGISTAGAKKYFFLKPANMPTKKPISLWFLVLTLLAMPPTIANISNKSPTTTSATWKRKLSQRTGNTQKPLLISRPISWKARPTRLSEIRSNHNRTTRVPLVVRCKGLRNGSRRANIGI